MTNEEIERVLLCVAQMAAILEAGDRAAFINISAEDSGQCNRPDPLYYARRARTLYDAAEHVISYEKPETFPRTETANG